MFRRARAMLGPVRFAAGPASGGLVLSGLMLCTGVAASGPSERSDTAGARAASSPVGASEGCEAPLAWRIGELDPAFGLSEAEAADAVRAAAALWEGAAGRPLFPHDPTAGFPIDFVHDERHARIQERLRRHRALDEEAERIAGAQEALEALRIRLATERPRHQVRTDELARRLQAHRAEVEYWNRQGGAPPAEVERLRRVEAELEEERREVNAAGAELNVLVDRVNERTREVNRDVESHNLATAEFREAYPPESVQSGRYRESRRTLGPWVLSVERQISIYQFDDRDHLVLVLAHELGHALGVGHSGEPAAVMYVYAGQRRGVRGGPVLHARDVEELRRACGGLGREASGDENWRQTSAR